MRDNHEGLPEIVGIREEENAFFVQVGIVINEQKRVYELATQKESFDALKSISSIRPFDAMPGPPYRYFFASAIRKNEETSKCFASIRIEQGQNAKQYEVETPKDLIANLLWFFELKDCSQLEKLRRIY